MPGFVEPLKHLFRKGHSIDFAILGKKKEILNISVDWLKDSNYYWINYPSYLKLFPLIYIILSGKYDFVYAHGSAACWGNIASILTRIPCGVRFYGTFLSEHLQENWVSIFWSSPLEFLTYNLPKRFMLVTNDGTVGDMVYKRCSLFQELYDFNFWLNGVDSEENDDITENVYDILKEHGLNPEEPFLLYPARYSSWKRQDYALEIANRLHKKGFTAIQLLFCGHISDFEYYKALSSKIEKYYLSEKIILAGALPKVQLRCLYKQALATMSLYDLSNLGNVLIEASAEGALVITRKDGTTDFLIKHNENGFLISNAEEAADIISLLITDTELRRKLSMKLRKDVENIFEPWEKRAKREIQLIENAVGR
jgi:glycosyltransferase involved in cell wall biosynthesis